MRLQRLTGLERQKIEDELKQVGEHIEWLKKVLADVVEIYKIIVNELTEIKEKFADPRRTKIEASTEEFHDEDLIAHEDVVVSVTNSGFIKRIPLDQYKVQKRGGKGVKGSGAKDEDFVWRVFSASSHDTLLTFTDRGKIYWTKVYQLPQGSRTSKGKAIQNVVQLSSGERTRSIVPVSEFKESAYTVMVTESGIIKKTKLDAFSRPRPSGLIALTIDLEDNLQECRLSYGKNDIFIATKQGMSIRFDEADVRAMGRTARGVKGITLGKEDKVIAMEVVEKETEECILIVTESGYGKRTSLNEYRKQSRGGVGIITQKVTDKVGGLVAARLVDDKDEVLIMTNQGQSIRMKVSDISKMSRNTQGVRLINLKSGEFVTDLALIDEDEVEEQES
jgi:DNA gyrase subunit A